MIPNNKEQQSAGANPSPTPSAAGSPEDLQRARNENERANENMPREQTGAGETTPDVGSEITDGEDA